MDEIRRLPRQGTSDGKVINTMVMLVFVLAFIKCAWIADDAAISLRTVLNTLAGYGPVFNVGERVQAYTHPLWFLVITAVSPLIGNVFYAVIVCGVVTASLALWLLVFRLSRSLEWGLVAALVLLISKAFMDFSVSGLETPLSCLVLALYGLILVMNGPPPRRLALLTLCGALGYLTRPDLVLFMVPGIVHGLWLVGRPLPGFVALSIGGLPVVLWTLFSVFYYGFPFPNPAYAKLGAAIPLADLHLQGVQYLFDSINRDPVSLFMVFFVLVSLLWWRNRERTLLAIGVALYLFYIIRIGGDFMSGRFLAQVVFASAIMLVLAPRPSQSLAVVVAGVLMPSRFIQEDGAPEKIRRNGVVDERAFWYDKTGLLSGDRWRFREFPRWVVESGHPKEVEVVCGGLGFRSVRAGPDVHFVDPCGLADPLLARLPARAEDDRWATGHYLRDLPEGYLASVRSGSVRLQDPALARYLERLNIVTRADLFSWQRMKTIAAFNLGIYQLP